MSLADNMLLVNDDFDLNPMQAALINDIKTFGVYSHVFQYQDRLIDLIRNGVILNDPIASGAILDGVIKNNLHVGKNIQLLLKSDNLIFDEIATFQQLLSSQEAVEIVFISDFLIETFLSSRDYMKTLLKNPTAVKALLNTRGLDFILSNSERSVWIAYDTDVRNAFFSVAIEGKSSGSGTTATYYNGKALVLTMRCNAANHTITLTAGNITSNPYNMVTTTSSTAWTNTFIIMNPTSAAMTGNSYVYVKYIPF